jgi:hypothetical protein
MTLIFADGFERYAAAASASIYAPLLQVWRNEGSASPYSIGGRLAGLGLRLPEYEDDYGNRYCGSVRTAAGLFSAMSSGVIGFGLRVNSFGVNHNPSTTMRIKLGTSNRMMLRITNSTGYLQLLNGAGAVLATWPSPVALNTWYYIELKFTLSTSSANCKIRINGFEGINFTGATSTGGDTFDNVELVGVHDPMNSTTDFDDFYLCSQAGSYNNDFLGNFRTQRIAPSGAGTSAQWTPSTGTNHGAVDEVPPNGASDFVSTDVVDNIDSLAFTDPTIAGTIVGVATSLTAMKVTVDSSIAPVMRIGGTYYEGATVTITDPVNYTTRQQLFERNPADSSAWTNAVLSAAEFGIKKK